MNAKSEQLRQLFEPVVDALGCQLWGLELLPQGKHMLLRIYIDKADGVGVEDCERVSRQVSSLLDVEDPISGEYTLEVSSPGADRPLYTLAQCEQFIGESVSIKLRFPYEGRRNFKGLLKGVEDGDVVVEVDNHEYLFPFDGVEKANIIPRF
ncbi:ribosome maturation factor RimP [Porticoccus sp. W117]|uniref:ribosome maturation factor RimP n=1 Tax=Porticoccus sp. W117 TaxID=3054777 RepID=UPI002591A4B3|nr:ribosome maturation factor RimP [Porticoccus sp. W117]MDM3871294.1 ribosome maturation factor RimP [Porticoccus sp. W117]